MWTGFWNVLTYVEAGHVNTLTSVQNGRSSGPPNHQSSVTANQILLLHSCASGIKLRKSAFVNAHNGFHVGYAKRPKLHTEKYFLSELSSNQLPDFWMKTPHFTVSKKATLIHGFISERFRRKMSSHVIWMLNKATTKSQWQSNCLIKDFAYFYFTL